MKKELLYLFLLSFSIVCAQQISIPRIDLMPNMPTPYLMRDWKQVTIDYDNFVFDTNRTGTYLPITKISTADGINYPELKTIRMDTYIGSTDHGNTAEAINILPAIVGASLVGIDKTTHLNTNWVQKIKDFYNLKNGQNVYLNSYSTGTGDDWWYEMMPNVFFYQLLTLYPTADADFNKQFTVIANRELEVLSKLGGTIQPWKAPSMNYRAFNLKTGLPTTTSVPEPETAGSMGWLMYQAYVQTNNPKYLQGAELALDFLQNWTTNPSYEIQLPYGIVTAARMNAVEGTNYDVQKMMNWTFSSGQNTLRGWGCIVGNWNGYEVSGLIGEANDAGDDYAFSMNGFQHAAALAPVAKYDKRYARVISKWLLNLANSSRLFYSNALPPANQQPASYNWSRQYDETACIPYESLKQKWNGTQLIAMGDAVKGGWAATDLSLYSGSSVGYLASIISKTNVEGILQIDLNKTDFRGNNAFPNYLYFNPTTNAQSVELTLSSGNYDIYDALTETVLRTNVTGTSNFDIPANGVRLLVIYPTGKTTKQIGRFKTIDGNVIDYHSNNNYTNPIRIKAFSVSDTLVQKSGSITAYCLAENLITTSSSFQWFRNNELIATTATPGFTWNVPVIPGIYQFKCKVSENTDTVTSIPISITVVEKLIVPPSISDIVFSEKMPFELNATLTATANVNTSDLSYSWSCVGGTLTNSQTSSPNWQAPNMPGVYSLSLTVNNSAGTATLSKLILVKDFTGTPEPMPMVYYPFNNDTKNYAQDAIHAIAVKVVATSGANNAVNTAYQFPSNASYIYTPNVPSLNFQDKMVISFWLKPDVLPSREQFILSHGSWEERYKISITPEKKVRWTVKTNRSVVDVDADTVLQIGKFDHFTALYTGYSLELYRNGKLSDFKALSGQIQTTSKSLTIARKDEETSDYNFVGTVDEVRIYDTDLSPQLLSLLPNTFQLKALNEDTISTNFDIYPNPFSDELIVKLPTSEKIIQLAIFDLVGKLAYVSSNSSQNIRPNIPNGFYLIKISTESGNNYQSSIIKN